MLVSFLTAGIAGVVIGFFFRASTLVAASFALLVYAAIIVAGRDVLSAILLCFALMATMQLGYIAGLAVSQFRKKMISLFERVRAGPVSFNGLKGQKNYAGECQTQSNTKQTA